MEPDYIDIQMERRRQLFFGVILALVVGCAVIYYFFGSLINRGTLLIYMEPPFKVDFYERKEVVECTESPCKIVKPMGYQSFFISKEGYDTFFTTEKVKLWGTVERKIDMKMNSHFAKVEKAPVKTDVKYSFGIDPTNQMQGLFNSDDSENKAIVYFPKALTEPEAFGDDKIILVIDRADSRAVYKVNIKEKSKLPLGDIPQFKNIISGKWSNDGKFFVASILRQPNLWIMDESGVMEQTTISSDINLVTWRKDYEMITVTENTATIYNPVTKTQESITLDSPLTEAPSNVIFIKKDGSIYVQSGELFYQLILE